MEKTAALPISEIIDDLKAALSHHDSAVLIAPPGAGKTTSVPLNLSAEAWLNGKKIVMLEPRRLAARAAANFMAQKLGEAVGKMVGYSIRFDSRPGTKIQVVTEGILTRMLQSDPSLEDIGLVIFDEFHERSIHADLGLAMCRQVQQLLRPDLKILVMSATLDAEPVAKLLGDAPLLISCGQAYPVVTHHLEKDFSGTLEAATAQAVLRALRENEGDVLVFLPGAAEIRRVQQQLTNVTWTEDVSVFPLYGNLPQIKQDQALAPCPEGRRKIVLATSIAETSLTVDGVRCVVDCGLMRRARFSPRTGMSRLETLPVSKASADQRRGRAGRQAPGVCYRLWTRRQEQGLVEQNTPELFEADLAGMALELSVWGIEDPKELVWLDLPPGGAYLQAVELLKMLGALDAKGRISEHGRRMAELGLHPRLAHMLLAAPIKAAGATCDLAAMLGNRDVFSTSCGADLELRFASFTQQKSGKGADIPEKSFSRLRAESRLLRRSLRVSDKYSEEAFSCGSLLALAYPDRIAQNRGDGRFLLSNGRGAYLKAGQHLAQAEYLVAAELDDRGREGRIHLAAAISLQELRFCCASFIKQQEEVAWNRNTQSVRTSRREMLGALILQESPVARQEAEAVRRALLGGIALEGLDLLPWTKQSLQLRKRLAFLHAHDTRWPDVSDEALHSSLEEWLGPYLIDIVDKDGLKRLQLHEILLNLLSWEQRSKLDEAAPQSILVPSGQRAAIDYSDPAEPVLAVRLQELFGLSETPCIAWGRVPLLLHLLSPANRPVQVTRDLASFWRNTYFMVRKDLLGRYPKHYWPDDPLTAQATNRTKAKMNSDKI